jgi:hypothetical protein
MDAVPESIGQEEEETQLLEKSYHQRYMITDYDEQEERVSASTILGHIFMMLLLLQVTLVYLKSTFLYENQEFTYLMALAIPFTALTIIGCLVLYTKYVIKLKDSHEKIHCQLTTLVVVFGLNVIVFVWLFSLYIQTPENQHLIYLSLIGYYVALLIWLGFLIYISPGLFDKVNGIPSYQIYMFYLWTITLLLYPILYATIAMPNR